MKHLSSLGLLCACLLSVFGCENTFSPDGPYRERMVVYGILSTRSDTQFVDVYTTRPTPDAPAGTHVSDARVTVTQGADASQFSDTIIQRTDPTGRVLTINAYVSYTMHLQQGVQYHLTVSSFTHGTVSSQATSLLRGTMLTAPDLAGNFGVRVFPGVYARAYIVRLFLDYELRRDTTRIPGRMEIPSYVDGAGNPVYPRPVSRETRSITFASSGFSAAVTRLRQQSRPATVRLLQTEFVLTQLDSALYAYYSTVNGFPDSGTLRLDEPDYTNIEGGLGIFAMTSETVVIADTAGQEFDSY